MQKVEKNSEMDSDCAYFSDKQEDDDDIEDQTLNFNVQSHDQLPQ